MRIHAPIFMERTIFMTRTLFDLHNTASCVAELRLALSNLSTGCPCGETNSLDKFLTWI